MPTEKDRATWARQKRAQRERIRTQPQQSQDQEEDDGGSFWTS